MGRLVSVANLEVQGEDLVIFEVRTVERVFSKNMLTCPRKTFCSLDPSGTPSAEDRICF